MGFKFNPLSGELDIVTTKVAELKGVTVGSVLFVDSDLKITEDVDLFWDNTNKRLGVGTGSPDTLLHLKDSDAGITGQGIVTFEKDNHIQMSFACPATKTGTLAFGDPGGYYGKIVYDHATDSLYFIVNNSEKLRVSSSGNVGIGTITPTSKVHIDTESATVGQIIQGAALQSADLSQWKDSVGTPNTVIDQNGNLDLDDTTSSVTGVLMKRGNPFLHNFHHPTGDTAIPTGWNVVLGESAGNFTMGQNATNVLHGSYNLIIGATAGQAIDCGYYNSAIGRGALRNTTDGQSNVGVGAYAMNSVTTGNANLGVGSYSGYGLSGSASFNSVIGDRALFYADGSYNSVIGYLAGRYLHDGSTQFTGSDKNVFIGANIRPLDAISENEIIIGFQALGEGSNSIVIGNDAIIKTILKGNVGIGTITPISKVHIDTELATTVGSIIRGAALQSADLSQWKDSSGTVLNVVDANGNIGIGTDSPLAPLHIYQKSDGSGLQFNGFDDNSTKFGRLSINNLGNLNSYSSAASVYQSVGYQYFLSGDNIYFNIGSGKDLLIRNSSSGVLMDIDESTGNVGIGTTTPTEKLEVTGNIMTSSDNDKYYAGTGKDMSIYYDGIDGYIKTDEIAPSDLKISCGANKTLELQDKVYNDQQINLGEVSGSSWWGTPGAGIIEYRSGSAIEFQDSTTDGYKIRFNTQISHEYAEGEDIEFHLHIGNNGTSTGNAVFKLTYEWTNIEDNFPVASSTTQTITIDGVDGKHQIETIVATISGLNKQVSSILLCTLERLAGDANDDFAGSVYVIGLDFHIPINTIGSRTVVYK